MAETAVPPPNLGQCMKVLEAVSAHPEQLLSVQEELASKFSQLTKVLYDLHKSELALEVGSPLKELVVENFDEEQIWQQIELENSSVLDYFKKAVTRSVKDEELCLLEPSEEDTSESEFEEDDSEVEPELDTDSKDDEKKEGDQKRNGRKESKVKPASSFSDDNDSDLDFDIDKLEQQRKKKPVKNPKRRPAEKSIVDDQFFKLADMEAFLEAVEKEDGRDENDEDDIDYFEDIESDDDEEEEDLFSEGKTKQDTKSSRDLHYKDYFDSVENEEESMDQQPSDEEEEHSEDNEDENISMGEEEDAGDDQEEIDEDDEEDEERMEETEESKEAKQAFKRVTFDLSDESEGEDVGDVLGGKKQQDISEPSEPKSSFEKREEKMTERIQALQNQMLEEKVWQLSGEVTAQKRPENSLLSETVQFDHASRMAPIITEETTLQLEDVIKQRIKDQVWDDVVRKEKPKENPFEFKKRLTLDHDKSKLSLAEVYEQEYLKLNQKKAEEEENPKHVEIQKMMDSLFLKLDALSNFHFTPKPAVPEIKVVSNLPAISMEEVAPVGVSEATLLAPEEVKEKNKAGDIKTTSEKTPTDKKRERRKKKLAKKMKIKEKEQRRQLAEKMRAESGKKPSKEAAAASVKKLAKEGKATILKDEGKDKALKSSQAFFSELQDQVKIQIKGAKAAQKKPKKENQLSAHKLKL
ncbi:U3 small nucleolar ribonucleoprotein protein MPP10 [Spea bombifrons]|uniref:U3 small nucleolar ribonucleoprotein protein MPP10 n=1 Tax=Spea bombifrons TaxID=233779 RepID=UPI002349B138|nr:U3 small nucleolar ribonucleoprotein protein MPP10 [Spea bombifrons]